VAQPQLPQCTTSSVSIFEPELDAVIPIAHSKNVLDVAEAVLNGLTHCFHALVAQLLAFRQFVACNDRSKVASNVFKKKM
jgi:hypothetical protein